MTEFFVREATAADFTSLLALFAELDAYHAQHFPHLFQPYEGDARPFELFADALADEQQTWFVAAVADGLLGFVTVRAHMSSRYPVFRPLPFALVDNIVVTAAARGQGVAQALMGAVGDWARDRHLTSVQLSVYAGNVAAERLYEKLGFAPLRHILIQPLTDN